jgi:hypothetical protein
MRDNTWEPEEESEEVTCIELGDDYADLTEKELTNVTDNCCTGGSLADEISFW